MENHVFFMHAFVTRVSIIRRLVNSVFYFIQN